MQRCRDANCPLRRVCPLWLRPETLTLILRLRNQKSGINSGRKEILLDAEPKFPQQALIKYNLACYFCQMGDIENAKNYLRKAFEIDLNWRKAALDDEDLRPLWDSLQTTVEKPLLLISLGVSAIDSNGRTICS